MINLQKQSGFSLVETLVAMTILLLVIIGPMSISTQAARSTSYSSEQVVAFFLAQEGAELAQKARDDLQLQKFAGAAASFDPWANFTDTDSSAAYNECFSADGCGLELVNGDSDGALRSPINCGSNSCRIFINNNGGRAHYTYMSAGATSTPYTRAIKMKENAGQEVEVISAVTWQPDGQRKPQTVEVKTYLFNVYKN